MSPRNSSSHLSPLNRLTRWVFTPRVHTSTRSVRLHFNTRLLHGTVCFHDIFGWNQVACPLPMSGHALKCNGIKRIMVQRPQNTKGEGNHPVTRPYPFFERSSWLLRSLESLWLIHEGRLVGWGREGGTKLNWGWNLPVLLSLRQFKNADEKICLWLFSFIQC